MEETMIAARKSLLLGITALALLSSLSGCIVAARPAHFRADYVAQGPAYHQNHWSNNGWQGGNGGGGDWNNHYH
jgi:hypothetical protein